jgi:hypothetical protein
MKKKSKRHGADLASTRGRERAAAVAAGELHLYRPKARPFIDRSKVANRTACRGRFTAAD